jgi:hypothetical protein
VQVSDPTDTESQTTGLPGFKSWRTVYTLVTCILAAYVVLLALLTRKYQ